MTDQLLIDVTDGIATLTMNRPEARNAMTGEMLAALETAAIGYMKRNLNAANEANEASLAQVLDMEAEPMVRTMQTEDHANAARAFVEKRAPKFRGR